MTTLDAVKNAFTGADLWTTGYADVFENGTSVLSTDTQDSDYSIIGEKSYVICRDFKPATDTESASGDCIVNAHFYRNMLTGDA